MGPQRSGFTRNHALTWLAGVAAGGYVAWLIYASRRTSPGMLLLAGACVYACCSAAFWARARAEAESWPQFLRRTWDLHLLGVWLAAGLILQQLFTEGITSDGALYLAHLRSFVFDRDFEITRELEILNLPPRGHHVVPLGPSIVWAPLYLIVSAVETIARAAGLSATPRDVSSLGLTYPYRATALLSSYLAAALGLLAVQLRLREEFRPGIALLATLLLSGATPLAWYVIYEPSIPHATAFGAAALFTAASIRWLWHATALTRRRAILLGALFGVVATIRTQDAVFIAVPALAAFEAVRRGTLRLRWPDFGWAAAGAAPFAVAQGAMLVALLPGQEFALVGDQAGYLQATTEHLFDVLFSSWYGLFSWTPIAYVAVLGAIAYVTRQPYLGLAGLLVFGGTWLANGAASDWHGSWAFGARRFVSALVVLAPGLALVLEFLARRPMILTAFFALPVIAWNIALMAQFHTHTIPRETAVRFETLLREPANWWIPRVARFYPFAFPDNLWFAVREGLPIDRYDELGFEPLTSRSHLLLDDNSRNDRFLLDGWGKTRSDVRWMHGRQATLVMPLRPIDNRPIQLDIEGEADDKAGAVQVVLAVEINGLPAGHIRLETMRTTAVLVTPADAARKIWRTGLNRITFSSVEVIRLTDDHSGAAPLPQLPQLPWSVALRSVSAGSL